MVRKAAYPVPHPVQAVQRLRPLPCMVLTEKRFPSLLMPLAVLLAVNPVESPALLREQGASEPSGKVRKAGSPALRREPGELRRMAVFLRALAAYQLPLPRLVLLDLEISHHFLLDLAIHQWVVDL